MKRRILLVNLVLLVGIFILAQQLVSGWWEFEMTSNVRELVRSAQKHQTSAEQLAVLTPEPVQPFAQFAVVPERDLFSQERRPPVPEEETAQEQATQEEKPPVLSAKPFLYGISAARGKKQALMTILTDDKKREPLKVRLGDQIQGYTVTDIGKSTVTLTWKDRKEIIDMRDAPPAPAPKQNVAVTVITVGAPVQAVMTTEAAAEAQPERGLEVAVVGGQQGQQVRPGQQGQPGVRQGGTAARGGSAGSIRSRNQRPNQQGTRTNQRQLPRR